MAGLTKQHFNAIAEILNGEFTGIRESGDNENLIAYGQDILNNIMFSLCSFFKEQNPLFDLSK